jgi:heat shock protein HtpX
MKRIVLFLATNLAVMLVMSLVLSMFGVNRFLTANGLDLPTLLVFSLIVGFTGAIFSLLISKPMAKWTTDAHVIETPVNSRELWLLNTVRHLSENAGIGMPEVAIYEGAPNAFATGAFRDSALVAVSTGLLSTMSQDEVEAVLGHEVAHIANGDMVTMTLIQGVVNTFVIFLARVVGYAIDRVVCKGGSDRPGIGYMVTVFVCEIVFGILASIIVCWFSRQREFRADAGSAKLLGNGEGMINALNRLAALEPGQLPKSIAAAGISDRAGISALFSTHPPMEQRIAALKSSVTML